MKPKRIILIRHGESAGNYDSNVYSKVPDCDVALTEKGHNQAIEAGIKIKEIIGNESVKFYFSPYQRTIETLECLQNSIVKPDGSNWDALEEVRLREQEYGHLRCPIETINLLREKAEYHHFFYRIKDGESGADVYDRVASFFSSLFRDFEKPDFPENAIIVTHGFTLRAFLMKWYRWTVKEMLEVKNPYNCQFFIMEKNANDKYDLITKVNKRTKK